MSFSLLDSVVFLFLSHLFLCFVVKPHRDSTFLEKRFGFEEHCANILSNMDTACQLRMISGAAKVEALKHEAAVVCVESYYVLCRCVNLLLICYKFISAIISTQSNSQRQQQICVALYPLNYINQNNQRIQFPLDECLLILYFDFSFIFTVIRSWPSGNLGSKASVY